MEKQDVKIFKEVTCSWMPRAAVIMTSVFILKFEIESNQNAAAETGCFPRSIFLWNNFSVKETKIMGIYVVKELLNIFLFIYF